MDAQGENVPTNRATSMKSADIQITDAPAFLKRNNRLEIWCAATGVFVPFAMYTLYELWLAKYMSAVTVITVLLLLFNFPAVVCYLVVINLHKKLKAYLPPYNRKDLLKELGLLETLDNPAAWRIYWLKVKVKLLGVFFVVGQIATFYISLVHVTYFGA
ncbi:MAG: hypothetical protein ACKVOO_09000 [Burkholderiaceae bacterium]